MCLRPGRDELPPDSLWSQGPRPFLADGREPSRLVLHLVAFIRSSLSIPLYILLLSRYRPALRTLYMSNTIFTAVCNIIPTVRLKSNWPGNQQSPLDLDKSDLPIGTQLVISAVLAPKPNQSAVNQSTKSLKAYPWRRRNAQLLSLRSTRSDNLV